MARCTSKGKLRLQNARRYHRRLYCRSLNPLCLPYRVVVRFLRAFEPAGRDRFDLRVEEDGHRSLDVQIAEERVLQKLLASCLLV